MAAGSRIGSDLWSLVSVADEALEAAAEEVKALAFGAEAAADTVVTTADALESEAVEVEAVPDAAETGTDGGCDEVVEADIGKREISASACS